MAKDSLLIRRVEKVLPSKEGLSDLISKKKIRLYQGFDPTGARLHLGHSVGIRKLMDFARDGHEVIFLFGTGTVLAGGGDPSGRDTGRKMITQDEINRNIKDWKDQVSPLVDWNKVKIKQNGDWLIPLTLRKILNIASNISAVQIFKREMFQKRIERGDTVWLDESLYPLLQGYDSVAMDVDLEIGGTDQEFNMLIGRELQRKMNNHEKYVVTVPMILGTDGKQMSKSSGNCVWLDDSPEDMFGKLMRIPDTQIVPYMELVTDVALERVKVVREGLERENLNPMEAKRELAIDVVTQFHGDKKAAEVSTTFKKVIQEKGIPKKMPILELKVPKNVIDALVSSGIITSKSEIRRLIDQGGLEWNGEKLTDSSLILESGGVLKIGKHKFLNITLK